ncbi:MAG: DUF4360 domain-containing protein [Rhizobacter sp.]|nr:DUF4360 domain-containing protein [Bacteriovorax sp.]
MKKMMMKGLCLGLLAMSTTAFADLNDVQLGIPGYGGNGCPANTASVTLSDDKKSLSLIFDQFIVEAGGMNKVLERKTCNIAIPVHVPSGFSVSVINVDYRGYVSLPGQASARLTAEYFLAGSLGPRFDKTFLGKTDTDYTFKNDIGIQAQVWSPCGADTILRVNAAMLVKTNRYNDEAMATVDSADFKTGMLYQFQWRRCQ